MSKTLSGSQNFSSVSVARVAGHYPRLEEINRKLFPLLVPAESTRAQAPRFADLISRFSARRPA